MVKKSTPHMFKSAVYTAGAIVLSFSLFSDITAYMKKTGLIDWSCVAGISIVGISLLFHFLVQYTKRFHFLISSLLWVNIVSIGGAIAETAWAYLADCYIYGKDCSGVGALGFLPFIPLFIGWFFYLMNRCILFTLIIIAVEFKKRREQRG